MQGHRAQSASSGDTRVLPRGDLRLLESDAAKRLLNSALPARLAYVWSDGPPRAGASHARLVAGVGPASTSPTANRAGQPRLNPAGSETAILDPGVAHCTVRPGFAAHSSPAYS